MARKAAKIGVNGSDKSRIFRMKESRFFNSVDSALNFGRNVKSVSQPGPSIIGQAPTLTGTVNSLNFSWSFELEFELLASRPTQNSNSQLVLSPTSNLQPSTFNLQPETRNPKP
jgi:hypothetical protein